MIAHRFMRRSLLAVCLGLCLAAAACNDSPTAPSATPAFRQTDLRVGTGAEVVSGSIVTVNYAGWLFDPSAPEGKGLQFETSLGRQPLVFTMGIGDVIAGWELGIVGMKAGGLRRLIIPPSLAYGIARNGPIPPNATLLFDIEVISVE